MPTPPHSPPAPPLPSPPPPVQPPQPNAAVENELDTIHSKLLAQQQRQRELLNALLADHIVDDIPRPVHLDDIDGRVAVEQGRGFLLTVYRNTEDPIGKRQICRLFST